MSITEVKEAVQAGTEKLLQAGFDLVIQDQSYVMDPDTVVGMTEELEKDLTSAIKANGRLTALYKRVAFQTLSIARYCIGSNGHPSWNFGEMSDAAKSIIGAERDYLPTSVYGRAFATVDNSVRTQVLANVRQHRSRLYLEPAIVDYVLSQHFQPDSEARKNLGELKWVERVKGDPPILAEVPMPLKKAVAEEYRSAKLTVPEKFGGPAKASKKPNAAGPEGDKPSAAVMAEQGLGAISALAPRLATFDLLRAISAVAVKVTDPDTLKAGWTGRPETIKDLHRIGHIAILAAKVADGKAEVKDLEGLAAVLYDPKKDQTPSDK